MSEPCAVGRVVPEGGIGSPINFNIGLKKILCEADGVSIQLGISGGIKLCEVVDDRDIFVDDVT